MSFGIIVQRKWKYPRNICWIWIAGKPTYDRTMLTVNANQGGIFFLNVRGGTGKTFWISSLILTTIWLQQKASMEIASSDIAVILFDEEWMAHRCNKKVQLLFGMGYLLRVINILLKFNVSSCRSNFSNNFKNSGNYNFINVIRANTS